MSSTPSGVVGKGKSCAVSGCTEPRLHRNYCAKHHNASLGKSDPLRVADLERCVQSVLEAMQKGVDATHQQKATATSDGSSIPVTSGSPEKLSNHTTQHNEYVRLLQPITEKILENIKQPTSVQPLPGSQLDIFSFSSLTAAAAASVGASSTQQPSSGKTSPPRPMQASQSDSDLAASSGGAPPSPDVSTLGPIGEGPIIDIKVQHGKPNKKKLPAGYELLEKSISGKYEADINKSGSGKSVMLFYQRGEDPVAAAEAALRAQNEPSKSESDSESGSRKKPAPAPVDVPKPITSLSVIFRDASEEPPYGFVAIDKNTTGTDANLNNTSSTQGRQVYLCVHRGEGAPIYDLGVIFHERKETLPAGFHELKHTPFGNRADLNAMAHQAGEHPHAPHQAVFLCFRPHVTPVLQSYPPLLTDRLGTDSVSKGHLLYAKVLALLTALLYAYDQKMVLHALEGFMKIPAESIPPVLLNRFLQCVCDAAPCFQTYFTTQAHTALLKFLAHAFKTFYIVMSIETFAKILEVCFLTRHEDKQNEVSEGMIASLIGKIERAKPCVCSLAEKQDQASIGMNAVAGGEGHSKPTHHHKATASGSVGTGGNNIPPAASSPASSGDGSTSPPVVSSILCASCLRKRTLTSASLNTFCKELVLDVVGNVHTAKDLEAEAKTFQRHMNTGVEFRADVAKLVQQLATHDTNFLQHIDKFSEPSSTGSGASAFVGGLLATPSSRPNSSGGRSSIIGGSCMANSLAALAINDETSATGPATATPATTTTASASAFAFDEVNRPPKPVQEKDRLFLPNKEERFLQVATLVCAKFAGEIVAFGLTKSEQMKRKLHALRLLFYILHNGVYFFRSTPGGILLIRRFICPALMNVCVTDNSLLWRLLLQTFTVLYDSYRQYVMIEIGVFFDHILLSLLESSNVTYELKSSILEMFHHILSKDPHHLIGLFYNFDNHSKNWVIFERLNTVLARITEGEQKSFVPILLQNSSNNNNTQPSVTQPAGATGVAGGANASSSSSTTQKDHLELAEQQDEALQRQALKLLVHNLHMLAQWVGVPGLKRSPDIPSKPIISDQEDDEGAEENGTSATAATEINNKVSKVHRASRIDTWSYRHDKQKQDQKILQEALKLARTENLKSALKYLRIVDPSFQQPKALAHFLFSHEGLDKAEVGDFLGSCGDKFMPDADYETLRAAYLEHLDFTGLLFDQGLRLFLCDSGFRLPGEAQKIDRLLESFCLAYCRDNPSVFRNHSSAFIVSFALVMLNTDLHDSRLRSGASRRQPMTEEQFIGNLRGVDDKHDFPRVFLETLYKNIAAQAIEWKEKPKTTDQALAEEKAKENQTEQEKNEDQQKAVRKTFEITVRRALAYLKNSAAHEQGYNRTENTMIAAGMFEVIWYRIISVITLRSDNYKPGDVELLHICLEGLAYGSTIAICLGLPTERQAFSRQLAKISFIERNRESIKANGMHLRIVQGEHLKQEWYRPFNLLCEKSPARACHVIFECAHDIKQKINYERRQAKLRQIESDFNHEIILVDPNRSYVREGFLTKLSNSSTKKQPYMFMLFNDCLLYASEGMNSKWKCHRVIHLSLCRLEDLRGIAYADAHAFRIVSPQKSFVVSAPSKEKKQQWLEAIFHHLKLVMAKRKRYIDEARKASSNATSANGTSASGSPNSPTNGSEELLRRYSTFIGQSETDLNKFASGTRQDSGLGSSGSGSTPSGGASTGGSYGSGSNLNANTPGGAAAAAKPSGMCKLCIRPWAIFRRKQKCRYCVVSGTPVNLASGRSVLIEQVKSGDEILALSKNGSGLVGRRVHSLIDNGSRECVELLFEDGRTLTITPDHCLRRADGTWMRADELQVASDPSAKDAAEVAVGVEYPLASVDTNCVTTSATKQLHRTLAASAQRMHSFLHAQLQSLREYASISSCSIDASRLYFAQSTLLHPVVSSMPSCDVLDLARSDELVNAAVDRMMQHAESSSTLSSIDPSSTDLPLFSARLVGRRFVGSKQVWDLEVPTDFCTGHFTPQDVDSFTAAGVVVHNCSDSVCNDCCAQKCMIPGGEKRLVNVCDACFGAVKGMIGDEVKLLTVSDS